MTQPRPLVGVVMGSDSDWAVMQAAASVLEDFGVPHETRVVSAHRTPHDMLEYSSTARERGLHVIVAGAGGAAHLPGMLAAATILPVVGVPIENGALHGIDALLSIAQMPAGVPVATMAVNGARNAGLLALRILALARPDLSDRLAAFQGELAAASRAKTLPPPGGP